MDRTYKISVVGDATTGKTSLLMRYAQNRFPDDYTPTILDEYKFQIHIKDKLESFMLVDTAGHETYDRLRPFCYKGISVFLLTYSVVDRNSYDNIKLKWEPEIRQHSPNAAIILVATKIDLKESRAEFSTLNGHKLAKNIKAIKYLECSALEDLGVKEIFADAMIAAIEPMHFKPEKIKTCTPNFFRRLFGK